MKSDPIDEFRRQANVYPPDNFHRVMPVAVFRVTWTEAGENKEAALAGCGLQVFGKHG